MSTQKGTLMFLKLDATTVVGQTSFSMANAATMIEVSSKDSGDESEFVSGRINRTGSVAGLCSSSEEATKAGYHELYDLQLAGAAISFSITEYDDATAASDTTGAVTYSGSCLISNLSWDASDNAAITFSCDFQVTGTVTKATNS